MRSPSFGVCNCGSWFSAVPCQFSLHEVAIAARRHPACCGRNMSRSTDSADSKTQDPEAQRCLIAGLPNSVRSRVHTSTVFFRSLIQRRYSVLQRVHGGPHMAFQARLGCPWSRPAASGRRFTRPKRSSANGPSLSHHRARVFLKAPMCRSCGRRPASSAPSNRFWS